MSGYQNFKAFLAELKSKASKQDGVYIPESENPLLLEKGVILVSQRDVRRLDLAKAEFEQAIKKMETAKAALHGFEALSVDQLNGAKSLLDSYNSTIQQIVSSAYARRAEMRGAV